MKKILFSSILLFPLIGFGLSVSDIEDLVGYRILGKKIITGWYDPDSGKKGTSFEGCNYGRLIIFTDNTFLRCEDYNYDYDYMPSAIILANTYNFKMIVGHTIYNMSR